MKQFNSPGVDLNMDDNEIKISNILSVTFKDDFKLVTPTGLQGGFEATETIIQMRIL